MQKVDLMHVAEFAGIAERHATDDGGVQLTRVPLANSHLFGALMGTVATMPSGGRVRFRTDSTQLVVRMEASTFLLPGGSATPLVLDVQIDGAEPTSFVGEGGSVVRVDLTTEPMTFETLQSGPARFEATLPGRMVDVDVWLPQSAGGPLLAIEVDDDATLEPPKPDERPRWVHYGSSISQCGEAHSPSRIWPAVAARLGGWNLFNLGLGGECHLDHFIAKQIRDLPAERISCKIGINIVSGATLTQRTFVPALHAFLDTVREGHPDTPLIVASPIWCAHLEERPGPGQLVDGAFEAGPDNPVEGALTLQWVRACLAEAVAWRVGQGDANLSYVDGLALFAEADSGDLPDNLHPNGDGYVRMGERWHALVG